MECRFHFRGVIAWNHPRQHVPASQSTPIVLAANVLVLHLRQVA
jgi:hypothetical protein